MRPSRAGTPTRPMSWRAALLAAFVVLFVMADHALGADAPVDAAVPVVDGPEAAAELLAVPAGEPAPPQAAAARPKVVGGATAPPGRCACHQPPLPAGAN